MPTMEAIQIFLQKLERSWKINNIGGPAEQEHMPRITIRLRLNSAAILSNVGYSVRFHTPPHN